MAVSNQIDKLKPVADSELRINVFDVRFNGVDANVQCLRNG